MIRIIIFFVVVAVIAAVAVWIVDEPGEVVIVWGDWQLVTSPGALVAAGAIIGVVAAILWQVVRWFWTGPSSFSHWRAVRRQRRGYRALSFFAWAITAASSPRGDMRISLKKDSPPASPPASLSM